LHIVIPEAALGAAIRNLENISSRFPDAQLRI
jgi:hypothetical protein